MGGGGAPCTHTDRSTSPQLLRRLPSLSWTVTGTTEPRMANASASETTPRPITSSRDPTSSSITSTSSCSDRPASESLVLYSNTPVLLAASAGHVKSVPPFFTTPDRHRANTAPVVSVRATLTYGSWRPKESRSRSLRPATAWTTIMVRKGAGVCAGAGAGVGAAAGAGAGAGAGATAANAARTGVAGGDAPAASPGVNANAASSTRRVIGDVGNFPNTSSSSSDTTSSSEDDDSPLSSALPCMPEEAAAPPLPAAARGVASLRLLTFITSCPHGFLPSLS